MSTLIQPDDTRVQVRVLKKVAPCGSCGEESPRDDMWALNVKVYAPDDSQKHVQIRLCPTCAGHEVARATMMQWDNSKMRVLE